MIKWLYEQFLTNQGEFQYKEGNANKNVDKTIYSEHC